MNNQAFSKIWIVVIAVVIIGGGILGYWWWMGKQEIKIPELKMPEKVLVEANLSSDLESIQVKKDGKLTHVYTIQQWQEWAKKNWSSFGLEPVIIVDQEIKPDDFIRFISISLSSDKSKIAFAVNSKEIALVSVSISGILNLKTNEINIIPNLLKGDVEEIIWSPTDRHFAYTIGTARAEGDKLSVDDVLNKKNSFMLDGEKIGLILEEASPAHFISQFRDVKWSSDGEKLYFKTNGKGNQGEVEWVINVDGTDLKKVIKDETANWKTYRDEIYKFEIKYPESWQTDGYYPGRQEGCIPGKECTMLISFFSPPEGLMREEGVNIFVIPPLYEESWEEAWKRYLRGDLENDYLVERGVLKKYEEDKTEDKKEYLKFLYETLGSFRKQEISSFCKNEELSIGNIKNLFQEGKIRAYCFTGKKLYLITNLNSYFRLDYKENNSENVFNQMLSTFRFLE